MLNIIVGKDLKERKNFALKICAEKSSNKLSRKYLPLIKELDLMVEACKILNGNAILSNLDIHPARLENSILLLCEIAENVEKDLTIITNNIEFIEQAVFTVKDIMIYRVTDTNKVTAINREEMFKYITNYWDFR